MTNRITELLKSKSTQPDIEAVQARKDRWLTAIDALFSLFDEWLKDAVAKQAIAKPILRTTLISEQRIGSYFVPQYHFAVGSVSITFTPKATYVLGAHGRVDATSSLGRTASLALIDKRWKFVDPKNREVHDLDEQRFLDLLNYLLSK